MTHILAASPHTFIRDVRWQARPAVLFVSAGVAPRHFAFPCGPDADATWSAFGLRAMREADSTREQCAMGAALLEALSRSENDAVAVFAEAVRATVRLGGFTYGSAAGFFSRALRRLEAGFLDAYVERELARLGLGLRADCQTLREQQQAGRALAVEIAGVTRSPITHSLLQWFRWTNETEPTYARGVEAQNRLFSAIASWDAATAWTAHGSASSVMA